VILTGTAGDGKTFHIRKFFLDLVADTAAAKKAWEKAVEQGGVLDWPLKNGRRLRVIRDVTALGAEAKVAEVQSAAGAMCGDDAGTVFLMAANDGQLLQSFAAAANDATSAAARCKRIYAELIQMMRNGREQPAPEFKFSLLNLSRTLDDDALDGLFDAVLTHPNWETGCAPCPRFADAVNPCPIRYNRNLLAGAGDKKAFRSRIKTLVRVAAANDQHIPIRYLLMLIVNILLGSSQKSSRPMLNCNIVLQSKTPLYKFSNPYDNACGANIQDPEKRGKNPFFAFATSLGIGSETDNEIDAILLTRDRSNQLRKLLFDMDPVYGERIFDGPLDSYLKRGGEQSERYDPKHLRDALRSQRRRLFFTLEGNGAQPTGISGWRLTVFHHAGEFVSLCGALREKKPVGDALRQIVLGINRTLTGLMANDGDKLWLTGIVGRADGIGGRVAMGRPVETTAGSKERVHLSYDGNRSCPVLSVAVGKNAPPDMPRLLITPLLFEYLKRVASGSLPSSFSRQCHQEIRHFAVRLASAIYGAGVEETAVIRMLDLDNSGRLHEHILEMGT
jgi:hypothetical protein